MPSLQRTSAGKWRCLNRKTGHPVKFGPSGKTSILSRFGEVMMGREAMIDFRRLSASIAASTIKLNIKSRAKLDARNLFSFCLTGNEEDNVFMEVDEPRFYVLWCAMVLKGSVEGRALLKEHLEWLHQPN